MDEGALTPIRLCAKCKTLKAHSQFYKRKISGKCGGIPLGSHCKSCVNLSAKPRMATWRERNREKLREKGRKRNAAQRALANRTGRLRVYYKLKEHDFNRMLALQNHRCAICDGDDPHSQNWCVDHDHSCCPTQRCCGKCIRGILCANCNRGLGAFKDTPKLFDAARMYLVDYKETEENRLYFGFE